VLIVVDQKLSTLVATGVLALGVLFTSNPARAAEKTPLEALRAPMQAPLAADGAQAAYWTQPRPGVVLGNKPYFHHIVMRGPVRTHTLVDTARLRLDAAVRGAGSALHMIATAYTAGCYGCSGITAMGLHAGHGIVAVDPRIIPLGTHLYVPGYGKALAGDTGGAIKGLRIDLGFNSLSEAIRFGRREITVYVLR
jgi:3D (Asp-Asp-Asp) domain-containing protein